MPLNLKPFEKVDYYGFDAKPFPNGDAPLVGYTDDYTLVIGGEQGELFDDYHLGKGIDGTDVIIRFDTTHFKSADEAIRAIMGMAECLLHDKESECKQHGTHLYQEHDSLVCYACEKPITPTPND